MASQQLPTFPFISFTGVRTSTPPTVLPPTTRYTQPGQRFQFPRAAPSVPASLPAHSSAVAYGSASVFDPPSAPSSVNPPAPSNAGLPAPAPAPSTAVSYVASTLPVLPQLSASSTIPPVSLSAVSVAITGVMQAAVSVSAFHNAHPDTPSVFSQSDIDEMASMRARLNSMTTRRSA